MPIRSVLPRRCAVLILATMVSGPCGIVAAADLPPRNDMLPPAAYAPPLDPVAPVDPGPASESGYYGYYGYDIFGVPYGGLYSANVACLRSVWTPRGYRTVNVC